MNSWFQTENNLSLKKYIKKLLNISNKYFSSNVDRSSVRAIFVPHAGIRYSGLCAASAYNSLKRQRINRVILLCTDHYGTKQVSSSFLNNYQLNVKTDQDNVNKLFLSKLAKENNKIFHQEHSFFVQLPFLQEVLPNAEIIPLIIGEVDENHMIKLTTQLRNIYDDKTVIICTSDTSHINGHFSNKINNDIDNNIRKVDSIVAKYLSMGGEKNKVRNRNGLYKTTACGNYAINLFMKILDQSPQTLYSRLTCYYTSLQREYIDISNKRKNLLDGLVKELESLSMDQSSVGYIGMIYTTTPYILPNQNRTIENMLTDYEKVALLAYARKVVKYSFNRNKNKKNNNLLPIYSAVYQVHLGTFVTLKTKTGQLRGCIGTTGAKEDNLLNNVRKYSLLSAFSDSRFEPLRSEELSGVRFEISFLTEPKNITLKEYFGNQFILDRDGILLESGGYRGFFLPSVAIEFGYNKKQLLEQLCQNKIGIKKNCYLDGKLQYVEGMHFSE